jgi:hypothetical protein
MPCVHARGVIGHADRTHSLALRLHDVIGRIDEQPHLASPSQGISHHSSPLFVIAAEITSHAPDDTVSNKLNTKFAKRFSASSGARNISDLSRQDTYCLINIETNNSTEGKRYA